MRISLSRSAIRLVKVRFRSKQTLLLIVWILTFEVVGGETSERSFEVFDWNFGLQNFPKASLRPAQSLIKTEEEAQQLVVSLAAKALIKPIQPLEILVLDLPDQTFTEVFLLLLRCSLIGFVNTVLSLSEQELAGVLHNEITKVSHL